MNPLRNLNRALLAAKARAWSIHLLLSALIFVPLLYLIWAHWFPPPFFFTDGGWQGVRIMLVVDLVIGPTLTLLIFNPAKSRRAIRFDFACIGAVQVAALIYGFISVESQRIQAVAFFEHELHAATKQRFAMQVIEPGVWERLGADPPYWAFVRQSNSPEEELGVAAWAISEGVTPDQLAFLYEPLAEHGEDLQAAALDWTDADVQRIKAEFAPLCAAAAARVESTEGLACLPLRGFFRPAVFLLDAQGQPRAWEVGRYQFDQRR